MYLAVHGWKVANIPIIKDIPLPGELSRVDRRRVIGLSIEHQRLVEHRKKREEHMGRVGTTAYSSPSAVFEELEVARRVYREGGYYVVDVTDKPIPFSISRTRSVIFRMESGLREMESIPSRTRKAAKSG
jgi:hypothetical protein